MINLSRTTALLCIILLISSCEKNNTNQQKVSELQANKIVHLRLGLNNNYVPPGGDDKNKDEFGCVVKKGEPPMTKCIESVGSTCKTLHGCEAARTMRASGKYTEVELKQSEEIGRMFNEIYQGN